MSLDIEILEREIQSIPSSIFKDIERNISMLFDNVVYIIGFFAVASLDSQPLKRFKQKNTKKPERKCKILLG